MFCNNIHSARQNNNGPAANTVRRAIGNERKYSSKHRLASFVMLCSVASYAGVLKI